MEYATLESFDRFYNRRLFEPVAGDAWRLCETLVRSLYQ
jgi:hypothetical protein